MYITPSDYGEWFLAAALPVTDDHGSEAADDAPPTDPQVDWEHHPRAGWCVFERALAAFRRNAAPDPAAGPDR